MPYKNVVDPFWLDGLQFGDGLPWCPGRHGGCAPLLWHCSAIALRPGAVPRPPIVVAWVYYAVLPIN